MSERMIEDIAKKIETLRADGLYKEERVISTPQGPVITAKLPGGKSTEVLNFCANNYLGLSNHPEVCAAATEAIRERGFGLSSVRFICGTQDIHRELERELSEFLHMEDAILYAAAFDANGGLFEPLLTEEDAIITDELNHASIIDGIRLCKAKRYRYKHADLVSLEEQLKSAAKARYRIIATDGVFSMDGDIAPLSGIVDAARRYDALVMVDDSHATGYLGATGRGTAEYHGVSGEIDLVTTTFGKALGGASGGAAAGRSEIIDMLRQRSRPYLFSNSLAPAVVGATRKALRIIRNSTELPDSLKEKARYFRREIEKIGYDVLPGNTAIVPVMVYDELRAVRLAEELYRRGVYVIGFTYPVVPRGRARIRVQISAAHRQEDLDHALESFREVYSYK